MAFILFWLATIGVSYAMEYSLGMKIYKDYADRGYIFNPKKNTEVSNTIYGEEKKNNNLIILIPFFNILNQINRLSTYNRTLEDSMYELAALGCIKEMTKEEKEEYEKNPTSNNAIKISKKSEENRILRDRINELVIHHENEDSVLRYNFDDDKINITSATGPVSKLTFKEQKDALLKASIAVILNDKSIERYLDIKIPEANNDIVRVEISDRILSNDPDDEINAAIETIKQYADKSAEDIERAEEEFKDIPLTKEGKGRVLRIERRKANKRDLR